MLCVFLFYHKVILLLLYFIFICLLFHNNILHNEVSVAGDCGHVADASSIKSDYKLMKKCDHL